MYDFTTLTKSIHESLSSQYSATTTIAIEWTIVGVAYLLFVALFGLFLVYAERKVCAAFQQRLGPMRVGPWGLLQTIADFIKLLMKELVTPKGVDKFLYNLAPFIVIIVSFLVISVIPFAPGLQTFDFDIGIFFVTAVSSVGVIGILLAGWSSNNKYSLIGAMRSGAQIVSYELSVGLSLITMIILAGTMQISGLVEGQREMWFIFKGHIPAFIAFFVFVIAGTAETNRGPFDLAEAESELTAGFHTEYSGIKFAFFFLAEYINLFIVAGMATTVFLGGWMPLHFGDFAGFNQVMDLIPGLVWFFIKVLGVMFLMMWFKWTFPRLRVDQILNLEWKYLLPINLFNILLMAAVVLLGLHF
ncbi:MAG: NADH-quinone oxidoreductase subunit NuoH [Lentimicrobiaceae bacterium]|nr:NADH-quinone oxidoreductase subunit NuoH [Lentimicrobiaceae bacterium]MCB9024069.1 NADH-quinone oxidoreductase subunit NuoH [Lentimicrobiaceae bacterium]MCO5266705.1 NADH-quinone oxidoreductase subunit NuoH [Lentimicrobium sp.]HPG33281.1 NADH-quinone oxidoreductase subunit NuoH [Lentimicrobium sp.]